MNAPWLFAEAYKYRVLHSCFSRSKFFKSYDVFFRQKCETFSRSSDAVFELATRFAAPYEPDTSLPADKQLDAKRLLFHELTQVGKFLIHRALAGATLRTAANPNRASACSLSALGQRHRPVAPDQHD